MSGCSLGPQGALELSRIALAGRLLTLRSARNVLHEAGFAALADAITSDACRLSLIDLSGCRLVDRSALLLVGALSERASRPNATLRSLQLHDNADTGPTVFPRPQRGTPWQIPVSWLVISYKELHLHRHIDTILL